MIARGRRLLAACAVVALAAGLGACGGGDDAGPSAEASATSNPFASSGRQFVGLGAPEILPQKLGEQREAFHAQAAAGAGLFRQTFRWDEIEPSKGRWAWGYHDSLVQAAAENGIQILPIVFAVRPDQKAAPRPGVRITGTTQMPPKDPEAFAAYATEIAKRYGPGGTFWAEHPDVPKLPFKEWQIWNEPNLPAYWGGRANQNQYARLLETTGAAIRKVDPKAEILTGGLPESKLGIPLDDYIGLLVRATPKGAFDTLAIHPYARSVDGVVAATVRAREQLDRLGRKDVDLWITEFGWAAGGPKSAFTVGPKAQGEHIAEAFDRLSRLAPKLRLRGLVYYAWRDVPPYENGKDFWGLHTGLLELNGEPKASLAAFTSAASALRNP